MRPVGFNMDIVGIGENRGFESLAGDLVGSFPVCPVFASRGLFFQMLSYITHRIVFLPHLYLISARRRHGEQKASIE